MVINDIEFLYILLELLPIHPGLFRRLAARLPEIDHNILISIFSDFLRDRFGADIKYIELLLDTEFNEFLIYSLIDKNEILVNFGG